MSSVQARADLNLFRVLEAIYMNNGISGAARALHLTQPAISHSLTRLRDLFDDPLFVRQGNNFVPTEKARSVMPRIQQALSALSSTTVPEEQPEYSELNMVFTVGFRDALEAIVFPVLMRQLLEQAPGVTVISRQAPREDIEKELTTGGYDIVVDRRTPLGARIRREYLCDELLVVVMADRHPWARQTLTRAQYLSARHIVVSQRGTKESIDTMLHEDGHSRSTGLVCQNFFAACRSVAASDMLLTMPGHYAQELKNALPVSLRPLPFRVKPIRLEMYWHENKEGGSAHRWMRQQIAEVIRRCLGQELAIQP